MEAIYYKATRLDGTDFRTGRVKYEVGRTVRPLPYAGDRRLCGPGYLHAAKTPSMTLVGGTWPCRLFVVSGKVAAGFDANHPHKGGFRQLTVEREVEAHMALGPNGRLIVDVIERSRRLTRDEVIALRAAWDAARSAAWGAAWGAARATASTAGEAACGAAGALCVRDLITAEHFNQLYGPWAAVIDKEKT